MPQRVLVVNHEASRSGAPTVAVRVLDALAAPGVVRVLVHRWRGPFRREMDAHADVSAIEPFAVLRALARRWKPTRRLATFIECRAAGRVLDTHRPAIVWCNTVLSANYVKAAQRRGIPVVLHVHEGYDDAARVLGRYGFVGAGAAGVGGVTLLGCARGAASGLARVIGVADDSVVVLYSPVDLDEVDRFRRRSERIQPELVRVAGCGQQLQTKGADEFDHIARELTTSRPRSVSFQWIGGALGFFAADSPVRHLGSVPTALSHFAEADIFALTSRSDQFPLVVLEAMALGLAVVAFSVGDVAEQLGDTGVLIEPGDREAMAAAITRLIDDGDERRRLGAAARGRAAELWGLAPFHAQVRTIVAGAEAGRRTGSQTST